METFADRSQPIVYVDTSEVRDGRLRELKAAMADLTEFVEANEPRLLAYNVYSTWNTDLIEDVGSVVGDELRGYNSINPDLWGLQTWAPVVDPLRDPRWGRNEEGYSEWGVPRILDRDSRLRGSVHV